MSSTWVGEGHMLDQWIKERAELDKIIVPPKPLVGNEFSVMESGPDAVRQ